jgi:hypothetical protein
MIELMFLVIFVIAEFFQAAKGIGSPLDEQQQITMQPVPKPVCMAWTNIMRQFQCQRSMAAVNQVLIQLNFIRCENANAAPTV